MPRLPERPPVNNTEIVRISKAMLREVNVGVVKKEEVPGVEMVRRMKKEKAAKILRAYRAYKLRSTVLKRIAARKISRWYNGLIK